MRFRPAPASETEIAGCMCDEKRPMKTDTLQCLLLKSEVPSVSGNAKISWYGSSGFCGAFWFRLVFLQLANPSGIHYFIYRWWLIADKHSTQRFYFRSNMNLYAYAFIGTKFVCLHSHICNNRCDELLTVQVFVSKTTSSLFSSTILNPF